MSKAQRIRQQNAREKIAAQQAAARRTERRKRYLTAGGSVAAVLIIVIVLVVVKLNGGGSSSSGGSKGSTSVAGTTQPASVIDKITHVPASTLNKVGTGTTYPKAIQTISPATTLLKRGGKPVMIYVGAEYCPYCAAERWGLTIALSRFGTFSNLRFIHSSSTDVYPHTPTLTFLKATYTSKYLTFVTSESRNLTDTANLQPVTALEKSVLKKYDVPPYVPSSEYDGSFPFVDFGNKYVIDGASYDPQVLHGKTWAQVAAALSDPTSPIAKGADGAANLITAAICKMTGGKPGNVCTSSGVTTASGSL
jgi:thiol-disulfide isomerase/thioredoxin